MISAASDAPRDLFQVMPALTDDEYVALADDIAANGVRVPVVEDQHGRLLDGHHRRRIAVDLGIDCPVDVVEVDDDTEARNLAYTLNLARRHLTREQKRALVARAIEANADDSDRAIARRLQCSPTTVGTVRRELDGELPQDEAAFVDRFGVHPQVAAGLFAARDAGLGSDEELREYLRVSKLDSGPESPPPPKPRRRPLPDAFFEATFDLGKKVERLERLVDDDRFAVNAERIAERDRARLVAAHTALSQVIDQLVEMDA